MSLLRVDNGVFQVMAKSGDKRLGGEDFNNNLLEYIFSKMNLEHNQLSKENLQTLRDQIER